MWNKKTATKRGFQLVQFLIAVFSCLAEKEVVVELSPGTTLTGLKKAGYDQFLGIPFAKPPVGDLRFKVRNTKKLQLPTHNNHQFFQLIKNPQPLPLWSGDRSAFETKPYCWQFDPAFGVPPSGDEDCLYLNVFKPTQVTSDEPLNVIDFVHGGGFYSGTNNAQLYGPDYFMETKQVILVTLTYRLNVFGFLNTGDNASPGNYGLKDQTIALRWVQRHIAAFGGDPQAVTLMGQSAGSVSVNYHLVSRHSEGLFKNAILLSGVIDAPWAQPRHRPREYVNRHAHALGIENAGALSSEELVEKFREISALRLTETMQDLRLWDILPIATYLPGVEPVDAEDPFLTQHPQEALRRGDIQKVPIMVSIVRGEAINFVQPILRLNGLQREFNARITELMPVLLDMDATHQNMPRIVSKIRSQYLDPSGIVTVDHFDRLLRMASDYYFGRPHYTVLQKMASASDSPIFVHEFNYRGSKSLSAAFTQTTRDYGVVHVDDLLYLFRIPLLYPVEQHTAEDTKAKEFFMERVVNFVKNDNPGYAAFNKDKPRMPRFTNSDTEEVIMLDLVEVERHDFWKQIDEMYDGGH